jgi:hypothetical protein
MTNEQILEEVIKLQDKYCDLVWYARSRPEHEEIPKVLENKQRIETQYPSEIKSLIEGSHPDWEHGFNSGMLAGMRYILDVIHEGKEVAEGFFPSLDS